MTVESVTNGIRVAACYAAGSAVPALVFHMARGLDGSSLALFATANVAMALFSKDELWPSQEELLRHHSDKRKFLLVNYGCKNVTEGIFAGTAVAVTAGLLLL